MGTDDRSIMRRETAGKQESGRIRDGRRERAIKDNVHVTRVSHL